MGMGWVGGQKNGEDLGTACHVSHKKYLFFFFSCAFLAVKRFAGKMAVACMARASDGRQF